MRVSIALLSLVFFSQQIFAEDSDFVPIPVNNSQKSSSEASEGYTILMSKYLVRYSEWVEYLQAIDKNIIQDNIETISNIINDDRTLKGVPNNWPALGMTWLDAIHYCNWLSLKKHLTPAYTIYKTDGGNREKVSWNRNANGFRLPTYFEWEITENGDFNRWNHSDLQSHSWVPDSPTQAPLDPPMVGMKKPNSNGIYDLWGLTLQFCWDIYLPESKTITEGEKKDLNESGEESRVVVGSHWGASIKMIKEAPNKYLDVDCQESGFFGIRLVRTYIK